MELPLGPAVAETAACRPASGSQPHPCSDPHASLLQPANRDAHRLQAASARNFSRRARRPSLRRPNTVACGAAVTAPDDLCDGCPPLAYGERGAASVRPLGHKAAAPDRRTRRRVRGRKLGGLRWSADGAGAGAVVRRGAVAIGDAAYCNRCVMLLQPLFNEPSLRRSGPRRGAQYARRSGYIQYAMCIFLFRPTECRAASPAAQRQNHRRQSIPLSETEEIHRVYISSKMKKTSSSAALSGLRKKRPMHGETGADAVSPPVALSARPPRRSARHRCGGQT